MNLIPQSNENMSEKGFSSSNILAPQLNNNSNQLLSMAQRRNNRRYEERRKRIEARFSGSDDMMQELGEALRIEGQYRSSDFLSFGTFGFADTQGRRPTMEDAHLIVSNFHVPKQMLKCTDYSKMPTKEELLQYGDHYFCSVRGCFKKDENHANNVSNHQNGQSNLSDIPVDLQPITQSGAPIPSSSSQHQNDNIVNSEFGVDSNSVGESTHSGTCTSCLLISIFDGHGGIDAANFSQRHLPTILQSKIYKYYDLRERLRVLSEEKLKFQKEYLHLLRSTSSGGHCTYSAKQVLASLKSKLSSILLEIIRLKYEYSSLVKHVSAKLKAPEIEHVETDDDDSSSDYDSDKEIHTSKCKEEEQSIEPLHLESLSEEEALQLLMRETFLELDEKIKENGIQNGCTATVILVHPEFVLSANVGDTSVLLYQDGKYDRLTRDHRPKETSEKERVRYQGGYITGSRVNGILAVSRALGDIFLKPFVSGDPYTYFSRLNLSPLFNRLKTHSLNQESESSTNLKNENGESNCFLVIACDGLWDFVSDDRVIEEIKNDKDPRIAAIKLRNLAFTSGSTDNISACVFRFQDMLSYIPVKDPEPTEPTEG